MTAALLTDRAASHLVAALAYVVSFEAIQAFAIEAAAFPPALAWSAPLLVDSFTTVIGLVIPVALPARGRLAWLETKAPAVAPLTE